MMFYPKIINLPSCYCRTTVGQTVTSSYPLFKVVYCKRKNHYYSPKPCFRKKLLPKARGCDMANKENELACAGNLPGKLPAGGRTFLLNSSDSGRSRTESPSSRYSGFFSEVSLNFVMRCLFWNSATTVFSFIRLPLVLPGFFITSSLGHKAGCFVA